jgi:alkylation response protein AidB-like acyl-CoA dehydrogenase
MSPNATQTAPAPTATDRFTDEDRARLIADVEAYCEELRPIEEIKYLEREFNPAIASLAKKHGICGIPVPKKYGGRGCDSLTYARMLARINREGSGPRTFFSGQSSIGQYPILKYGTEDQKQRYLPKSAAGDLILAFGLTEPDAGSNPLEGTTTYRREGDKIVMNGVKYLISNGSIADAVIVFAFPEGATGEDRRMSAIIVDTAGSTFEKEQLHSKPGMYTCDTAMFSMNEHVIRGDNLLGKEGEGFRIAMHTLVSGRLSVASG